MGLDMYLTAERFFYSFDDETKEIAKDVGKIAGAPEGYEVKAVKVRAMYWRKANAIHQWFVQNVQDGKDECQESWVSREQLEELRNLCKRVVNETKMVDGKVVQSYSFDKNMNMIPNYIDGQIAEDSTVAEKLLPTTSGFFFGSTEYDQWYFDDIKRTYEELNKILQDFPKEWDFNYQASW